MQLEVDVQQIYATLRTGGLALVPTDVGYGLVALEESAVRRIYELKGRPAAKPCVTVGNAEILQRVSHVPVDTREWIAETARLTPLAIVTRLVENPLVAAMTPYVAGQATHAGTIALFFSAGRILERLAECALADGRVVLGSSANLSGTGNNYTLADVPASMRDGADLVIDRGPAWYRNERQLASTILDLTTGAFLRQGVNYDRIAASWASRELAARAA
ncbi:MAG: Sua5/YciO/YrdC/YwlC family protein [Myxococcota bacterium]|nr:Sua5/YciO/YrdC/YwlC family protein [Myxococcota bacterium]